MECLVYKSGVFCLITLLKPVTIYKLLYLCGAINLPLCTQLLILCLSSYAPHNSCNLPYPQMHLFFWQDRSHGWEGL